MGIPDLGGRKNKNIELWNFSEIASKMGSIKAWFTTLHVPKGGVANAETKMRGTSGARRFWASHTVVDIGNIPTLALAYITFDSYTIASVKISSVACPAPKYMLESGLIVLEIRSHCVLQWLDGDMYKQQ